MAGPDPTVISTAYKYDRPITLPKSSKIFNPLNDLQSLSQTDALCRKPTLPSPTRTPKSHLSIPTTSASPTTSSQIDPVANRPTLFKMPRFAKIPKTTTHNPLIPNAPRHPKLRQISKLSQTANSIPPNGGLRQFHFVPQTPLNKPNRNAINNIATSANQIGLSQTARPYSRLVLCTVAFSFFTALSVLSN